MPRKATHKVAPRSASNTADSVFGRLLSVTADGDHFTAELLLTDPRHDYQMIRARLPGPIQPDNRIGRLLAAAGIEVVAGQRVDIDQAVSKDIRVRLMRTNGNVEPIDFAPLNDAPSDSKPKET
jgi:hypothetical protein